MKIRNFAIAVATGLMRTAPALAAGSAGHSGVVTNVEPVQHQFTSERPGIVQPHSQQDPLVGIACPPGPIMEEMVDPETESTPEQERACMAKSSKAGPAPSICECSAGTELPLLADRFPWRSPAQ